MDFDFESEDFESIAQDMITQVATDNEDTREIAHDNAAELYDLESKIILDPVEASQEEGLSPEDFAQVSEGLAAVGRLRDVEQHNADNILKATNTAKTMAQVTLGMADRDLILEKANTKQKLILQEGYIQELVEKKTLGIALKGVREDALNARAMADITLTMQKTEALIDSQISEIGDIRNKTEIKAIKNREAALKAAGIDGTFENILE